MTEGSPLKLLISFALPLMAGNVFQQCYTIVDTMVVGRYVGVDALSAMGAVDWLSWLTVGIIQGFTQGFSILMAQHFGAKDYDGLNRSIGISASLSLIISGLLLALSQLFARPLLLLMNTPENIIQLGLTYVRILFAGLPIVMLYNLLSSVLRALGDSKTPLYAMVIASLANIGLDFLFVLGFHWGMVGAAAATLIAQLLSVLYCLPNIARIQIIKIERVHFRPEHKTCGTLLRLGSPIALQNAIIAVGGMVVQSVVNGFGVIFMAGLVATNKLYGLLEIAATSYGYAVTSYVGQNLGAGRIDRIKKGMRSAVLIAFVTSILIAALMLLFGRQILGLFVDASEANVQEVVSIAYAYLCIMSVCLPILYMLHIYRSALMGLGNTLVPMVSGFSEMALRIAVAMILPAFMGQQGLYYAEVAAWLAAAILLVAAYYIQIRRYKQGE